MAAASIIRQFTILLLSRNRDISSELRCKFAFYCLASLSRLAISFYSVRSFVTSKEIARVSRSALLKRIDSVLVKDHRTHSFDDEQTDHERFSSSP